MGFTNNLRSFGRAAVSTVADSLLSYTNSDLIKGGNPGPVPTEPPKEEPKSLFWEPYAILDQLGYKDRPSNISYGTLKAIAWRVPILPAILQTRVNQVAAFSNVPRNRYELGYRIKLRDPEAKPKSADKKWIKEAQSLIQNTGVTDDPRSRDNFEKFLRKITWDTLVYDQMCFEIVPNNKGQPAQWYAIDAATIRLADPKTNPDAKCVQVHDGRIFNEYTQDEICFGIRNPRTDLWQNGYGVSEIEMLIKVVTALLWSWEYNQRFFSQGSASKGILNFKGTIPQKEFRAFRRHWYQMLSGVQNAWRTPITNAEDIQWVNLQSNNRDMEFNAWMDFLIKVACSQFCMSPSEVNFQYGNTGQTSTLNETNNRDKITESKERGLRPLLRFISTCINQHIIWPMNDNFEFEFVGLDAKTQDDVAELNQKRVKTYQTVNELRAEEDLPSLPNGKGDIILDPTWMQFNNMQASKESDDKEEEDVDIGSLLNNDNKEETEKSLLTKSTNTQPTHKLPALIQLHHRSGKIYRQHIDAMLKDINYVLDQTPGVKKSQDGISKQEVKPKIKNRLVLPLSEDGVG